MLPVTLQGVGSLEAIELWESSARLRHPVRAAHGTHDHRTILYLRLVTSEGEGWGEVAALDNPSDGDPSLGDVRRHLESFWIPRMLTAARQRDDGGLGSHEIAMLSPGSVTDRFCSAALEMALLDAELRRHSLSMAQWLHSDHKALPFGMALGIPGAESIEDLTARALLGSEAGASRVRAKIDPSCAVRYLTSLRSALGSLDLHADANGSYGLLASDQVVAELTELDGLDLRCIEQPLRSNDLTTYAQLTASVATPICLDEGLDSPQKMSLALRYEAASVFCVKPSRLGGLRSALAVLGQARDANMNCFIGGMFESGLARASLGVLAGHPACSLVSDIAAPSTYFAQDPCELGGPVKALQELWNHSGVGPWPLEKSRSLVGTFPRSSL
jgi:o-succinylbenzoate synthase